MLLRYFIIAAALTTHARATPQCYGGIAGGNIGPSCQNNDLYATNEHKKFEGCTVRAAAEGCRMNDAGGNSYDSVCQGPTDKTACEAAKKIEDGKEKTRVSTKSYDGTTNFCYWAPKKTDKAIACTTDVKTSKVDDKCWWNAAEAGPDSPDGSCKLTKVEWARNAAWLKGQGMSCDQRMKSGCFYIKPAESMEDKEEIKYQPISLEDEFRTDDGKETKCSDAKAEAACNAIAPQSAPCGTFTNASGTYPKQCASCTWIAKPANEAAGITQCATKDKGSLDDICSYSDGVGPPSKMVVGAGFEHGLFMKGPAFKSKCSMFASFRTGKGAATVLGANTKGLIENQCNETKAWRGLARHIGHTDETIKEYCDNFIPDTKAMDATLKTHSAGAIIAGVKAGQFATLFPGFKDQKYIITAKPEYGECLFTSNVGVWGAAICTCDTALCNNLAALSFIVDRKAGPMRLLQFLDGSLASSKDAINAVVPGLMDATGIFVASKAGDVTKANVDDILKIASVAAKTTTDELWGLVQDYVTLNKEIAAAKPPAPTTGKTTGSTTGATTGTKKDKKLVMKDKLSPAAKAAAKAGAKTKAENYKKAKDLKKAADAKLSAADKEKAKAALAVKKKTWSAKKKKKFKGKMNLKGIDLTKADNATKNAKIAFEEATVAELNLTPEDEIVFTYTKVAARRRLLAVGTDVSYEITVAEDTSAALEAKLTEDPEGTAILAMSAVLSTDFPETVTAVVISETVEDVAASTETPTSEKLNAATARAQTSAAVGAVSLVAVLSYFM